MGAGQCGWAGALIWDLLGFSFFNYHKLVTKVKRNLFYPRSVGQKFRITLNHVPTKGSRKAAFSTLARPCLFLATTGLPWLVDTLLQYLPLSSYGLFPWVSVCLCPMSWLGFVSLTQTETYLKGRNHN